jgi:hypothetical protein
MNKDQNPLSQVSEIMQVTPDQLASIFAEYYDKKHSLLNERVETSRYAVEVNFRTTMDEANHGFAKIALGYISAALKKMGYHVKLVFSEKPLRVIVSTRNWDDGEWVGMISYNNPLACFVLSKGYFNKMNKTVRVTCSEKIDGQISSANMAEKLKNTVDKLKDLPEKPLPDVRIHMKRGPKT